MGPWKLRTPDPLPIHHRTVHRRSRIHHDTAGAQQPNTPDRMRASYFLLAALAGLLCGRAAAQVLNDNINYKVVVAQTWADLPDDEAGGEEPRMQVRGQNGGAWGGWQCMEWNVADIAGTCTACGNGGNFNWLELNQGIDVPKNTNIAVQVNAWEEDINLDPTAAACTYDPIVVIGPYVEQDDYYFTNSGQFNNGTTTTEVRTAGTGKPCLWDTQFGYNGTDNLLGFQTAWGLYGYKVWRYTHGASQSDPLNFGPVDYGSPRSHTNSNRAAPTSPGPDPGSNYGYVNNPNSPGVASDVHYTFTLSQPSSVTISVSASNFSWMLALYSPDGSLYGQPSLAQSITTGILAAGTYRVVVDGYYYPGQGGDGDFTLNITNNTIPFNPSVLQAGPVPVYTTGPGPVANTCSLIDPAVM